MKDNTIQLKALLFCHYYTPYQVKNNSYFYLCNSTKICPNPSSYFNTGSHKIILIIGSKLHSSQSAGEHWVLGQSRQEVSYITGVVACTDFCLLSLAIWGVCCCMSFWKQLYILWKLIQKRSGTWYMSSTNIHPYFQPC